MAEQQIDELKNETLLLKHIAANHAQLIDGHTKDLEEAVTQLKGMQTAIDQQSITFGRQIEIALMGTAKGHKNIAESKIAASIEKFEGKRELWREWVSKFVTAIDQFRP